MKMSFSINTRRTSYPLRPRDVIRAGCRVLRKSGLGVFASLGEAMPV